METLFIHRTLTTTVYLKDANGFTLGAFNSQAEAEAWCKENGYRSRVAS